MTAQDENVLSAPQLRHLRDALHAGAANASEALGRWIERPARITLDSAEQLPLDEATVVLGESAGPICFCAAEMRGRLTGEMILAFDDASGLALADMVLGQPQGTASEWSEMETSAALETSNILCCAYLNALSAAFPEIDSSAAPDEDPEMLPSPPRFSRDFAESLIEFALMDQITATDHVLLARTEFHIDGDPVDWTLLFVPDAETMASLRDVLR